MAPEITVIVNSNSTQESIATISTVPQQVSDHSGNRCFAVRSGHTDIKRTLSNESQHIASFQEPVIMLLEKLQLFMLLWNRWRIHYYFRLLICLVRVFLKVHVNPFCFQLPG